jgi:trk system potassium uptake protein TrkH
MKKAFYRLMGIRPGILMLLAYLVLILFGSLVLSLPLCQKVEISFLDSFFTSASAVCVTGLITVDTATAWSFWGQLAILVLIQLGGLGIMTIATIIFVSAGRRISAGERLFFHESVAVGKFQDVLYILKRIFIYTAIIEAIGAVLLTMGFWSHMPLIPAVWSGIFHSIAAFCNAGFSIFSGNLTAFASSNVICSSVMTLIVLGGLGYFVMMELLHPNMVSPIRKLSVHAKSALTLTIILIIAGAAALYAAGGITFNEAMFQSVTSRTAGFNTVDIASLSNAAVIILLILMFIGASPGSTGGGIKTTAFLLVAAFASARALGKSRVSLFKRTIPQADIYRAVGVFILGILVVVGSAFGIIIFYPVGAYGSEEIFKMAIFEVVSALGTVGLSLGLTPHLTAPGKIIIILTMLVGKVGILSIAHSLTAPKGKTEIIYAEESVMIG